jgi:FKBP-type peptidyl-prolyl cis-trans isomerase 2
LHYSLQIELDLNHELAGEALVFDVKLVGLVPSERLERATFGAGCFWWVCKVTSASTNTHDDKS